MSLKTRKNILKYATYSNFERTINEETGEIENVMDSESQPKQKFDLEALKKALEDGKIAHDEFQNTIKTTLINIIKSLDIDVLSDILMKLTPEDRAEIQLKLQNAEEEETETPKEEKKEHEKNKEEDLNK